MTIIKSYTLFENLQQSKKILRNLDIPEDNSDYIKLKKLLKSNLGYLGKFTEWFFEDNIEFNQLEYLFDKLNLIKLDKPINYFKSFDDILYYIDFQYDNILINQVTKSIPSRNRKLFDSRVENIILNNTEYVPQIKKLLSIKSGGYKTTEEMINGIDLLIRNIERGWTIDSIKYLPEELVYKDDYLLILWINSYERSEELGSESWCIVTNKDDWDNYTDDFAKQYFIYDFSKEYTDVMSMIGVTVAPNGEIIATHDKNNDELDKDGIMDEFGEYLLPYREDYILNIIDGSDLDNLIKFNLIDQVQTFINSGVYIDNISKYISDAVELNHLKIASILLNDPRAKEIYDSIIGTIVMFHIGRGGRFHNQGYVTFKGEYTLSDGIDKFGVNYYFQFENQELAQEICDELDLCDDVILDNEDIIRKAGFDFDDLGELRVTDGDYHSGCTYEEWESGIGSFDIDGDYNTYYTTYLSNLSETEEELIIKSEDERLIEKMRLLSFL